MNKPNPYSPKLTTVFSIYGWIPFTIFEGEERPYMSNDYTPKAFVTKKACQEYCDFLNNMNA